MEKKKVGFKEKLVSLISFVVIITTIVWIIQGINFFSKPTKGEVDKRIREFIEMYHENPPIVKGYRGPEQISRFYAKIIDPLWKKTLQEKGDSFSMKDYYQCLLETVKLCKAYVMPFNSNFFISFTVAYRKSANNRKQESDEEIVQKLQSQVNLLRYTNWYESAISIQERKLDWKLLLVWIIFSYGKGLLMSLFLFLLQIVQSRDFRIKEEILIGFWRFARMVLLWPYGLCVYPHLSDSAIQMRYLRLKAELLRYKERYELSAAEEIYLRKLAAQPAFNLRKIISAIRELYIGHPRKSLVFVYGIMFLWIVLGPISRLALSDRKSVV